MFTVYYLIKNNADGKRTTVEEA